MDLYVGQTSLKGDFRRYAKQFNYVELLAEPQQLPTLKKVRELANASKGEVAFGVVLSPSYWGEGRATAEAYFKKVVQACDPACVVVRTPPGMRPGATTEKELALLLDAWRGELGQRRLVWEPRGLWQAPMIARVAEQLEVAPAWDLMALPAGGLGGGDAYVRSAALGVAARVNEGRLEQLAEKAVDCSTLHLVVEGKGALRARQLLQAIVDDPLAAWDTEEQDATDDEDDDG